MVQRWLQTLANNEFDVVHRLGRNHGNADALSRAPHLIENPSLKLDISMGKKIGAVICSLQAEEAWTPELVREGQEQDEELTEVRKWVLDRTKPTNLQQSALMAEGKKLACLFDSLYLDKDRVLCYDFSSFSPRVCAEAPSSVPTTQWHTRRLKLPSPSCTRQCTLLACTDG
jgi:hypothetical protein